MTITSLLLENAGRFMRACIYMRTKREVTKNPNIDIAESAQITSYEDIYCPSGAIKIGENSYINRKCIIGTVGSTITIGNDVLIGPGTIINTSHHNFDRTDIPIVEQRAYGKPIVIEDDVWIGAKCTILGGAKIGAHSVIGACSLVKGNIPPYSIAYGVPCKVVETRDVTTYVNSVCLPPRETRY